jgi:N-methylhydantoinase A
MLHHHSLNAQIQNRTHRMTQPAALVAVDVGGTFTDLILFDRVNGEMRLAKAPSTPPDYFLGVVNALTDVMGEDFGAVDLFIHGTTVHLNALLERKGVETGLITTKGFADVYAIGRGNRVRMYDLHFRKPEPIVPRDRIFEVEERLDADGEVLAPLAFADLDRALAAARAGNLRALAICFLHAYRNQEHEAAAAAYLREKAPDLFIAPSHEVCREWREFERTGTAVVNAYVSPILRNYLGLLAGALAARGFSRKIFLMQSNGGVIAAGDAETRGVLTLMSGPVGGNVGSHALSRLTGRPNLICIDMGGTSFEVSLIVGGEAAAAASPGMTMAGSGSGREAPAPRPGRPAMARAVSSRP